MSSSGEKWLYSSYLPRLSHISGQKGIHSPLKRTEDRATRAQARTISLEPNDCSHSTKYTDLSPTSLQLVKLFRDVGAQRQPQARDFDQRGSSLCMTRTLGTVTLQAHNRCADNCDISDFLGKQQLHMQIQTCSIWPSFTRAEPPARSPHVNWPFLLCTYGDSSAVEPSTAVRRVAISGLREALEIMESNPLASDEKATDSPSRHSCLVAGL